MGQAAAIVINDGTATPVAVTYTPEVVTPSRSVFVDKRKTSRALQPSFETGVSPATASRPTTRVRFGIEYPIEGTVNGLPAVIATARVPPFDIVLPDVMTTQDKKHLHALFANALDAALIKLTITDGEPVY